MLSSQINAQRGFSLLEALIASTIFAAVLLIASSAFKFFMSASDRPVNSELVLSEAMDSISLRNSIKGLRHYMIKKSAINNEPAKPFFLGNITGFTGITVLSMNYPHQPTRIAIRMDKDQDSIVYCEFDNSTTYPAQNIGTSCDTPRLLASNVTEAKFSYFGWSSLNHLYGIPSSSAAFSNNKSWSNDWDASERKILPQYIRVDLSYTESQSAYHPTQLWFNVADADPVQFNANRGVSGE